MFEVDIDWANPDPDANPQTWQEAVDNLKTLITASIPDEFTPYIRGSNTPAAEDHDKIWFRLDVSGRPMGTFIYYGGHWRRTQMGLANEYTFFTGNPATFFDVDGKGLVDTDWDGWQLANGNNGTIDARDKFVEIGGTYSSGWKTNITGGSVASGGAASFALTTSNTPRPARPAVNVGKETADGLGPDSGGSLYGSNMSAATVTLLSADAGVAGPTDVPTLPPFVVMALVKWIGYD